MAWQPGEAAVGTGLRAIGKEPRHVSHSTAALAGVPAEEIGANLGNPCTAGEVNATVAAECSELEDKVLSRIIERAETGEVERSGMAGKRAFIRVPSKPSD